MWVKIVWFILVAQIGFKFVAPAPSNFKNTTIQGDSENGTGDACCERRRKLEDLGPGINIYIYCTCAYLVEPLKLFHLALSYGDIETRLIYGFSFWYSYCRCKLTACAGVDCQVLTCLAHD